MPPPVAVSSVEATEPGHGQASPRVFLVDDDAGMRVTIRDLLTDAGCEVVGEASDAIEAVAHVPMVAVHGPVVVLMDVRMPGELNGIDATRLVLERTTNARVLIFSAFGDGEGIRQAAGAAGAVRVLTKGLPGAEIVGAIREVFVGADGC